MKRLFLLPIAAVVLLAACQKEVLLGGLEEETQSAVTTCYTSSVDCARILLARSIASCMRSQTFCDGLAEGLAQMRDGDNEVLMAEIFLPTRTSGVAWNTEVASQLAEQLRIYGLKTGGGDQNGAIEGLLLDDPLMQVLYVPANDDYLQEEVDLTANDLKIIVVPEDYDDQSSEFLLAYDCFGNETIYDPQDMESPLVVVGKNERLELVQGEEIGDDADIYLRTSKGCFIVRYSGPIDDKSRAGLQNFYTSPMPNLQSQLNLQPRSMKRQILVTRENILRACFTSNRAMRQFEARALGRPEVKYFAQMDGLTSGMIVNQSWKDARWVYINNEVGFWTLKTLLSDFYTVKWVEIDGNRQSLGIDITSRIAGVELRNTIVIKKGDDIIGQQSIYYQSAIDSEGYRNYLLGDSFEFTIRVTK